ncbi:glycosyltransferase [Rariglobus hedericola]
MVVDNATLGDGISGIVAKYPSVNYIKNSVNIGMFGNWNKCIALASGEWVHILHDDDMVGSEFYIKYFSLAIKYPKVVMIASPSIVIGPGDNEIYKVAPIVKTQGVLVDIMQLLALGNCFQPPSIVVRKTAYEIVGDFNESFFYTADWEMWARVCAIGSVAYSPEHLSCYRVSDQNGTSKLELSGVTVIESYRTSRELILRYDLGNTNELCNAAARQVILSGIKTAIRGLARGNLTLFVNQIHAVMEVAWLSFRTQSMVAGSNI